MASEPKHPKRARPPCSVVLIPALSPALVGLPRQSEATSEVFFLGRSPVSPATLDDHEGDTVREHEFVNMLSPWWSLLAS